MRAATFSQFGSRISRLAIVLLSVIVVLAGCGSGSSGDDGEGHQFANDRRATKVPTATAVATEEPQVTASAADPTVPPGEILVVRGAPALVYIVIDGSLQSYDTTSRTFTPLELPEGFEALDYASSPTGDRVGVLGLLEHSVVVQFFGGDGAPLGEPIPLKLNFSSLAASPVASPVATPVSSRTPSQLNVSWIPQGNGLVVSGPGVLQRVSMSGVIMPISRTGVTGTVVEAYWSPMDSQVAILTQMMDGHQGVFMLDSGHADARELNVLHLKPEQSLSNLQWLPNGLGMVLVAGNTSNGTLMNGQIYIYRFNEEVPKLVATSGQGGPAATITHAVVSPDGHSVAYAIMVRDQDQWHMHSLWIKPLQGGPGVSVPLTSNAPVTSIMWTAEGLVWQQDDATLSVVDPTLIPRPLGEEPIATPQATPVSTPESTPVVEPTAIG